MMFFSRMSPHRDDSRILQLKLRHQLFSLYYFLQLFLKDHVIVARVWRGEPEEEEERIMCNDDDLNLYQCCAIINVKMKSSTTTSNTTK